MNALTLLKNDHKVIGAMLDQVRKFRRHDKRLEQLATRLATTLTVHTELEESLFYAQLRDRAEGYNDNVDVFKAYTEHESVRHLVALVRVDGKRTVQFKAELLILAGTMRGHMREEETTIFALARQLFSSEELEELGARMESQKRELMEACHKANRKKSTKTAGAAATRRRDEAPSQVGSTAAV